jgi:hypothetical protein
MHRAAGTGFSGSGSQPVSWLAVAEQLDHVLHQSCGHLLVAAAAAAAAGGSPLLTCQASSSKSAWIFIPDPEILAREIRMEMERRCRAKGNAKRP